MSKYPLTSADAKCNAGEKMKSGRSRGLLIIVYAVIAMLMIGGCGGAESGSAEADIGKKLEMAAKYLCEDKYQPAILAYQEIINIDPKNAAAYQGLTLAFVMDQQEEKAVQAIQQGLKELPGNAELELILAGLWSDQNRGDQVAALYQGLISSQPEYLPAYEAYYHWLAGSGQVQAAIDLLEGVQDTDQQYLIYNWLAQLYEDMGQHDKAQEALKKSLALQGDQSEAYTLLQKSYDGRWAELAALGDAYVQQNHPEIGFIIKLRALWGQAAYEELIKQYQTAPPDLKENHQGKYLLAQAYIKVKQNQQAEGVLKSVKVSEISDPCLLSELAVCYLEMGNMSKARELAQLGIDLDPTEISNYQVMYRSYNAEDKTMARLWALKYLMNTGLGYTSQEGFYQGEFTGSYSGTESGTFTAVIGADKSIIVKGKSPTIGVLNGSGTLSDTGSLSFQASGSVAGGAGRVYKTVFGGGLCVQNDLITGSGTWSSLDVPAYGGNWSIAPVPWGSSTEQVLTAFEEASH